MGTAGKRFPRVPCQVIFFRRLRYTQDSELHFYGFVCRAAAAVVVAGLAMRAFSKMAGVEGKLLWTWNPILDSPVIFQIVVYVLCTWLA
jgi:hypothetical protein